MLETTPSAIIALYLALYILAFAFGFQFSPRTRGQFNSDQKRNRTERFEDNESSKTKAPFALIATDRANHDTECVIVL